MIKRHRPRDDCAPIMPDEEGLLNAKVVEQADDILHEDIHIVR